MKCFALLFILFCCGRSYAQLPVIYAEGGEDKNVNWEVLKKQYEENAEEGDLPFFYNDCAIEFTVLKASSELAAQGKKNYAAQNLSDEDPTTAWVPESSHNGIGESFEIASSGLNGIYNGYQTNPKLWSENTRVKKLKVYKDNEPLCYLVLKDEMGGQYFELPGHDGYSENSKHHFRFEIVEVYKGTKYKDVAISEIAWSGCCFAENTMIQTGNSTTISINDLKKGQSITIIELENDLAKSANVTQIAEQKHQTLLVISTPHHHISITPDHPLFVKDYGFISFKQLMKRSGTTDYSQLIGTVELLVWNTEKNSTEYEKLSAITVEKGLVNTYSIRALTEGNVFIANGFITKTY